MKKLTAKTITTTAVFAALSLIVFMIESLFPPLFVPGAKMGLGNIFSMLALIYCGAIEAFVVLIVRILLGSMLTGSMSTLMYSLPAGIVAFIVSCILYFSFKNKISFVSISIAAAVIHNLVQNTIYIFVSNTSEMKFYYPYLALTGVFAGAIVGIAVILLSKSPALISIKNSITEAEH